MKVSIFVERPLWRYLPFEVGMALYVLARVSIVPTPFITKAQMSPKEEACSHWVDAVSSFIKEGSRVEELSKSRTTQENFCQK